MSSSVVSFGLFHNFNGKCVFTEASSSMPQLISVPDVNLVTYQKIDGCLHTYIFLFSQVNLFRPLVLVDLILTFWNDGLINTKIDTMDAFIRERLEELSLHLLLYISLM